MSKAANRIPSPRRLRSAAPLLVSMLALAACTGGGGSSGSSPDTDVHTPRFKFKLIEATGVPTKPFEFGKKIKLVEKRYSKPARSAGEQAGGVLSELFSEAYLDPNNWKEGTYGPVWAFFDGPAKSTAEKDASALTVGGDAGGFDSIQPGKGALRVKVLFDDKEHPTAVDATVTFSAIGRGGDADGMRFVSTGTFFLRRSGGSWKVTSYEVQRADKRGGSTPSSPTGGAS